MFYIKVGNILLHLNPYKNLMGCLVFLCLIDVFVDHVIFCHLKCRKGTTEFLLSSKRNSVLMET